MKTSDAEARTLARTLSRIQSQGGAAKSLPPPTLGIVELSPRRFVLVQGGPVQGVLLFWPVEGEGVCKNFDSAVTRYRELSTERETTE